jgi:hypothetical protein
MSFSLTAKVVKVLPLEGGVSKAGTDWKRATVVAEFQDGQYTSIIAMTNLKKADEFALVKVGFEYEFSLDVRSREYNGKYYTDVNCYAWKQAGEQPTPTPAYTAPQAAQPAVTPPAQPAADSDDLPF